MLAFEYLLPPSPLTCRSGKGLELGERGGVLVRVCVFRSDV